MSDDPERVFLTYEEAVAMLPDSENIHTFRDGNELCLLGADWSRDDILGALRDGKPELAGELATRMKHGLVVWSNGWLFIQTRQEGEI